MIKEFMSGIYDDSEDVFSDLEDIISSGPPDPNALESFNRFKALIEKSKDSLAEDGLLWTVYCSFLATMCSLALSENSADVTDDFEARVSFIEKDLKKIKRILKRQDKTTR